MIIIYYMPVVSLCTYFVQLGKSHLNFILECQYSAVFTLSFVLCFNPKNNKKKHLGTD